MPFARDDIKKYITLDANGDGTLQLNSECY